MQTPRPSFRAAASSIGSTSSDPRCASWSSWRCRAGSIANASAQTSKDFAVTVKDIVVEINRSYTRDTCITMIQALLTDANLLTRLKSLDEIKVAPLVAASAPASSVPEATSVVAVVKTSLSLCQAIMLDARITEQQRKQAELTSAP